MPAQDNTLRRGMKSSAVQRLRRALDSLGYKIVDPPGVFGPATENAVRAFQKAQGLPVNGEVDRATLNKLRALARRGGSPKDVGDREETRGGKGSEPIVISGLVVDEGRHPLSGIKVRFLDPAGGYLASATTGGRGRFAVQFQRGTFPMAPERVRYALLDSEEELKILEQTGR